MKYLLDTHVFIWWLQDNDQLSEKALRAISDPGNEIFVSAASIWEMSIKIKLGKLQITGYSEAFLKKQVIANSFSFLPISLEHAFGIYQLKIAHKDPFDHMLIVQAQTEDCTIITKDSLIQHYDVAICW